MLSFPLSLADFWDELLVSSMTFDPVEQLESSGVASGKLLTREVGPTLWRGSVTLAKLTPAEAADLAPLLNLARSNGASFLVCDLNRPYPALDPTGNVLGAATVTVSGINVSRRGITLTGLPPNYPLSRGDLIGVRYGSGPVRYDLHRIVVSSSADVTGETGWNEVTPPVASGLSVGDPAELARPTVEAKVVPGSVQSGSRRSGMVEGGGFSFVQTLG